MSELDDRLRRLETELDALKKVQTQEDFDEGARLHAEKNAPWVNGQYSHLKFEPYVFRAFPKMLYSLAYEAACLEYDYACLIPARGSEEGARDAAMRAAQRKKDAAMIVVKSASEQDMLGAGWYESPMAAVAAKKGLENDIAIAAAHREYEDRNMGEQARAEMRTFDEAADRFVAEVPEQRRKPGPKPKLQETT